MSTNSWFNYESDKPRWWEKTAIGSSTLVGKAAGFLGLRRPIGAVAEKFIKPIGPYGRSTSTSVLWKSRPGFERDARSVLFKSMFDREVPPSLMASSGLKKTGPKSMAFDTRTKAGWSFASQAQSGQPQHSLLNSYQRTAYPGLGGMYRDTWDIGLNPRPNMNTSPSLINRAGRAFLGAVAKPVTIEGYWRNSMLPPVPNRGRMR